MAFMKEKIKDQRFHQVGHVYDDRGAALHDVNIIVNGPEDAHLGPVIREARLEVKDRHDGKVLTIVPINMRERDNGTIKGSKETLPFRIQSVLMAALARNLDWTNYQTTRALEDRKLAEKTARENQSLKFNIQCLKKDIENLQAKLPTGSVPETKVKTPPKKKISLKGPVVLSDNVHGYDRDTGVYRIVPIADHVRVPNFYGPADEPEPNDPF